MNYIHGFARWGAADLEANKGGEQTDIARRMAKILVKANAAGG